VSYRWHRAALWSVQQLHRRDRNVAAEEISMAVDGVNSALLSAVILHLIHYSLTEVRYVLEHRFWDFDIYHQF